MKRKLRCVLLVDDNESDNFLHKRVIEKSGITNHIAVVYNGKEAIEFLTSKSGFGEAEGSYCQPELIFLDINMPVMNAWEFLEAYDKLQEEQKGKIIVIMLTTSFNPNDKIKAETILGQSRFQYKPLSQEMIQDVMRRYFPDYL
jgi:CheY-like chemotaxis protein